LPYRLKNQAIAATTGAANLPLSAASHESSEMPSLWRPLRVATFRNLLLSNVVSDVGTFMQNVGAAWLMVSLNAGPLYIALTQTASSLPFFVFALLAGSIGDIVDRRKLILFTEIWMTVVALLLTGLTLAGLVSPVLLLILTFALSAGDAFESPSWRAILPELVAKEDLAPASALNGIEFNIARAVGPALAGALIAAAGVGIAFGVNAISFLGVIYVVARWKRVAVKRKGPRETLQGATAAAIRYVRYSPVIRLLSLRSGATMFFASSLLALLPSVAHAVSKSALGYGVLLGCFGLGAVIGALSMRGIRAHNSSEQVAFGGVAVFGVTTIAITLVHNLPALALILLFSGAAWILFISLFNVLILNYTPDWVRARVLAIAMLVTQGAMAGGSALWGALAARTGVHHALLWAGIGAIASTAIGFFFKLPDATVDLTPSSLYRPPAILNELSTDPEAGPVLVTVEYDVMPGKEPEFLDAIYKYERIRRRDGAYEWGIFQDMEVPSRYLETFLVTSWAEHIRQHERLTRADTETQERLLKAVRSQPKVTHLIAPEQPS
jgi:MFS family permease